MRAMPQLTTGQRIRAWRGVRGMTIERLAELVGGPRTDHLSRMERGERRIDADLVPRIAAALGLTMPEFWGPIEGEQTKETAIA